MKLLRILTGLHAGAEIALDAGEHRIGAGEDAEIRITDWRDGDLLLSIDARGATRARRAASAPPETAADPFDADGSPLLMLDFVPVPFGETALCVGPAGGEWPSDLDLLATLWAPPPGADAARRGAQRKLAACAAAGGALVAGLLAMGAMLASAHPGAPPAVETADALATRIGGELGRAGYTELHAAPRGAMVAVSGMVATPADDLAARKLLDRLAVHRVERRYDVAQDDAQSIGESLGVPGATVAYAGQGRFLVSGVVPNVAQLRAAVDRVRADVGPNVRAIEIDARQSGDAPVPVAYSGMLEIGDVRYIETPDGVKHVFAGAPADGAPNLN
ncbi:MULTISPECIES: HrpD5 family protein [Burkholderia]|uniref:Type III secretion system protein n=1 Tax=Burkholderia savannae TaxID=1637837 RepID=A0ABR5T3V2_9BURK|nr:MULTISPECIES: HrpD5 family protein [Burkholderia]AOJ71181.1 type III secretion system protein [Burkholderia savannae]AOK49575.1 type III secretion system protein [Burkholderia sp. MSMB617WGS]KGS08518.1 putative transmembrane protein [Burkholderia sp. ABCPW 111]KVG48751.1 type III secretion system protein [Burkholderia sp. MSMB0265]KVG86211.1 type III secretion system protein [Burkholderia sp. MSMB2040]